MSFKIGHNDAFELLGAIRPVQHWSSFNVARNEAYAGHANFFVTTCWNWHHDTDSNNVKTPTTIGIYLDKSSGEYWYRYTSPDLVDQCSKQHTAHWNSLKFSIENQIPIIALFKDYKTRLCDTDIIFDITNHKYHKDTEIWICIKPRVKNQFEHALVDDIDTFIKSESLVLTAEYNSNRINDAVNNSLSLSTEELEQRLQQTPKKPQRTVVLSYQFERSPDVVAACLRRANGNCEKCNNPAPFIRRKDNTPYLEVHHIIPLSDGGDDSLDNTIAICPNCHRKFHFG